MPTTNVGFKTKTSSVDPFTAGFFSELSKSAVTISEWDKEYQKYLKRRERAKPPEYKKTIPRGAGLIGLIGGISGGISRGGKGALIGAGLGALAGGGIAALATKATKSRIQKIKGMSPVERKKEGLKYYRELSPDDRKTIHAFMKEKVMG